MKNYIISHWKEITTIIAIIVSISSVIFAYTSWRLSKKDYLLTHRPFLWVENFGYLDENQKIVQPVNQVMIKVINSPASILKEKYSYYTLDQNTKHIINEQNIGKSIKYPNDNIQYTNNVKITEEEINNHIKLGKKVYRLINIEYKWLSSEKKYFFEGKWKYNPKNKTWDIDYQKAD